MFKPCLHQHPSRINRPARQHRSASIVTACSFLSPDEFDKGGCHVHFHDEETKVISRITVNRIFFFIQRFFAFQILFWMTPKKPKPISFKVSQNVTPSIKSMSIDCNVEQQSAFRFSILDRSDAYCSIPDTIPNQFNLHQQQSSVADHPNPRLLTTLHNVCDSSG
jgi:hypothetical protein